MITLQNHFKVVALDVYGTILASDDGEYRCPPRDGLEDFLDKCDMLGIRVVTSSDAMVGTVKNDLMRAFRLAHQICSKSKLGLSRFDGFFQLSETPKDFSIIIEHYGINSYQLLVVGDDFGKDICGAMTSGAIGIQCPTYRVAGDGGWNFEKI